MKRNPKIAFIGDLTVDKYKNQKTMRLGGSSLTAAVWSGRLGAQTSVIAAVGNDAAGARYRTFLKKSHINDTHVHRLPGKTSSIEIYTDVQGERSYGKWNPGVLAKFHLRPSDYTYVMRQDIAVLIVYDRTMHMLRELSSYFRTHGQSTLPLRAVDFGDMTQFDSDSAFVEQYIDAFDILFFGLLADTDESLINALRNLAAAYRKCVVITLGAVGSVAFHGSNAYTQIATSVPVVDTTGAGDAFLSGFLVEYFRSQAIRKSLGAGAELASESITKFGAY